MEIYGTRLEFLGCGLSDGVHLREERGAGFVDLTLRFRGVGEGGGEVGEVLGGRFGG